MAAKKKLQKKESAAVPEKVVGAVAAVEPAKPSRHAGTPFLLGKLTQDLADANDEVVEALKKAGFKPSKKPISIQPFTTDKNQRAYLAGFVTNASHREIIMPGPDFKSTFGSRVERRPMSDETKAYLKEKGLAKKMLRPKKPTGGVSIQDLCKELNIHPRDARKALRKAKIQKPDCGWVWATREEADAILKQTGLIGGKKPEAKVEKQRPPKKVTPEEHKEQSKKNSDAIQDKPKAKKKPAKVVKKK